MALLEDGLQLLQRNSSNIECLIADNFERITDFLNRYIAEIELFNDAYGLVNVKNKDELIIKHILDSLSPLGEIMNTLGGIDAPRIADAGSGAGLPGIPLAAVLPQANVTLIERMERRADFLRNTQAVLQLANVEIEQSEIEQIKDMRFDLICFRAFKPLDKKLLKKLFFLLKPDGVIAAYKGRKERILQELDTVKDIVSDTRIVPCPVPFLEEERHILFMRRPAS